MTKRKANGRSPVGANDPTDRDRVLRAIDDAYDLPGRFPVVLIAARDADFRDRLVAAVDDLQGDQPYDVRERESRHGNYVSYRLELHVESAEDALAKKAALATLAGVLMVL